MLLVLDEDAAHEGPILSVVRLAMGRVVLSVTVVHILLAPATKNEFYCTYKWEIVPVDSRGSRNLVHMVRERSWLSIGGS